jgi:predicted nucleotidyltransferase
MHRDDAVRLLQQAEPELRARGVTALALFGSTARDEAGPDSDIDVMIDLDMSRRPTLVDVSGVRLFIEDRLGWRTDLAIRDDLRAAYRSNIEADVVRIF